MVCELYLRQIDRQIHRYIDTQIHRYIDTQTHVYIYTHTTKSQGTGATNQTMWDISLSQDLWTIALPSELGSAHLTGNLFSSPVEALRQWPQSNGDSDVEKRLEDTEREGEDGMNGDSNVETYTLPYVKQRASENLRYDLGSSVTHKAGL